MILGSLYRTPETVPDFRASVTIAVAAEAVAVVALLAYLAVGRRPAAPARVGWSAPQAQR